VTTAGNFLGDLGDLGGLSLCGANDGHWRRGDTSVARQLSF